MSATGDDGFTLLEMLVVLAIAAMIAGIGFPRLQGQIAAQEARTAVSAVTAALRAARAQALRSGMEIMVTASPDGHSVQSGGAVVVALPASVVVRMESPIGFHGDGSARGGELTVDARDGELTVDGKGPQMRVSVASATGVVRSFAR